MMFSKCVYENCFVVYYNTFEIEAVSFLGDRMILTFNENLADEDNTLMIGVWGQSSTSLE